jgi:hypothetical protein
VQVELPLVPGHGGEPRWIQILADLDRPGLAPVYCTRVVARRRLGPWLRMDMLLLRPEDLRASPRRTLP